MNVSKRILSMLTASAMALTMTACGSSGGNAGGSGDNAASSGGDTVKVGCVVKFQHEFYSSLMKGAEDACDEYGWEFTGMAPQSADDVDGQVQMVEDMVTDGVDYLLVAPNQESTLYNAMNTAVADGTKIIAVDTDLAEYPDKMAFCGTDNYNALKTAGTELAKLLPKGANVIILRGALGDANHEKRAAGATDGLEEAGCNVLECFDAGSTAEGAAAAMEDFMTKYGNEINGVLCCGDDMASGAINAIAQAGRTDDIVVSGFDGLDIGIQNVADGLQAFDLSQDPYNMGYQAVQVAHAAQEGESFEESTDTGVQMITVDNYKDFQ